MKKLTKTTRSKGEILVWETFPDWEYEPTKIWYETPYIPDFVTPKGTLIEYKEFLDREQFRRLKYVAQHCAKQRILFIVLVLDGNFKDRWPKKGRHMVAALEREGIRAHVFGPNSAQKASAYIKDQEDRMEAIKALYASNSKG